MNDLAMEDEVYVHVAINENNAQGAVLWGTRSNATHRGVAHFNRLMVSQPGPVEFKVKLSLQSSSSSSSSSSTSDSHSDGRGGARGGGRGGAGASHQGAKNIGPARSPVLALMTMTVLADPDAASAAECTLVFREGQCARGETEDDAEALFPRARSVVRGASFWRALQCADTLEKWHVS